MKGMAIQWLLPLLFHACVAQQQQNIWVSAEVGNWSTKADLDALCNSEYPGGFALVCTAGQSVSQILRDDPVVITRRSDGQSWDTATPVAIAGEVHVQMFNASSSFLGTPILTIDGTPVVGMTISTSCLGDGTFEQGYACGGNYDVSMIDPAGRHTRNHRLHMHYADINRVRTLLSSLFSLFLTLSSLFSYAFMTLCLGVRFTYSTGTQNNWLTGGTGDHDCTFKFHVYCLESPFYTASPTTPKPPTTSPTVPLMDDPTPAPSDVAFTTPSPTPMSAPSAAPTSSAPSTSPTPGPIPSLPPSFSPSLSPSSSSPSLSPSLAHSLSPSHSPSPFPFVSLPPSFRGSFAPSSTPTKAPCPTCSVVISPTSSATRPPIVVGNPLAPVTIYLSPLAVPNCTSENCTVRVTVNPSTEWRPTAAFGGNSIVIITVYDSETPREEGVSLAVPVVFSIPFTSDLAGCNGEKRPECVWWNDTHWTTSGCDAELTPTATQCTCSHLTDFAVLLDASRPHPCSAPHRIAEIYYVFIILYSLVFAYCLFTVCGLLRARSAKESHSAMLLQHVLMGCVCVLRVLSCLAYLDVFGESLVLKSFVAATPYPLEYLLFTKLASTWAGLVHFSMLTTERRWTKIRPLFVVLNVVGTGLAIALFVMFVLEMSDESALAGTCVLASIYLALAISFNFYATKILRELERGLQSSGSPSQSGSNNKRLSGVANKIRLVGRGGTMCFVAQALCSVLALVSPSEQLVWWTAVFLLFNVLALVCLLAAYFAAVKKAVFPKGTIITDKEAFDRVSGSPSNLGTSGTDLVALRTRETN